MSGHKTSRRHFVKIASLGVASWLTRRLPAAVRHRRPNVLFISVDDLNDWIACLGHPDARTPNLDRLAARGALFTNAHCPSPSCNPSRTAVMTGIRAASSGIYDNNQPWRKSPALAEAVTIPGHFTANAYRCLAAGKVFHANPDGPSWDVYWPSLDRVWPGDPSRKKETPLSGLDLTGPFDWGPLEVAKEETSDWKIARWAAELLEATADDPWFLACGFYRPHLPWYAPRSYFDLYDAQSLTLPRVPADDLADLPARGARLAHPDRDHAKILASGAWRQAVHAYLACVSFVDDCLGQVFDALERGPHRDDTIVMLWSDHGWHMGQKNHWRKFTLWEESTKVPLMIVAPGVTTPGTRCDAAVGLIDLYPTLVDLCGLSPVPAIEGTSLAPLLRDPAARWDRPALTTQGRGNHALRTRRWRYIRYSDGSEELYDHKYDDLEWENLAEDPELAGIKHELVRWFPTVNAPGVRHG